MMMDRSLLERYAYKHEYARLVHDCWELLTGDTEIGMDRLGQLDSRRYSFRSKIVE